MSSFHDLFNAAFQNYANQTGIGLDEHPFVKQLEACDSVDSITAVLQERARIFCDFRGDNGKLMRSLKHSVNILYTLSVGTQGISLVRPKSSI